MKDYFAILEAFAALTGIVGVWYSRKVNILTYPFGLVSVAVYVYLCFVVKLYADAGINGWYFSMSIYGWWRWAKPVDGKTRSIQLLDKRSGFFGALLFVVGYPLLYFVLTTFTDSDVPGIDAFTTAAAITGMYWMAEKRLEHWYMWLLVNAVSIPLYLYKNMPVTSVQYAVFLWFTIEGIFIWRKQLLAEKKQSEGSKHR